jgi:toluene monooxygenase system ferredoxin subunit
MRLCHAMALADLWDGEMRACRLEDHRLLVLRHKGVVRAYEDRCAHQGVPLSEGELREGVLTCRAHCWQYDAATGQGINPAAACLKSLPVMIRDGNILVDVDAFAP